MSTHILAQICATKPARTKPFNKNIVIIQKNMPTTCELKRYKPKLDIVEKPENRAHELTDSNGARARPRNRNLNSTIELVLVGYHSAMSVLLLIVCFFK